MITPVLNSMDKVASPGSSQLNCHPSKTAYSHTSGTCYDASLLRRLVQAYNQTTSEGRSNPIKLQGSETPAQLQAVLAAAMRGRCIKEDCWLDVLLPPGPWAA